MRISATAETVKIIDLKKTLTAESVFFLPFLFIISPLLVRGQVKQKYYIQNISKYSFFHRLIKVQMSVIININGGCVLWK